MKAIAINKFVEEYAELHVSNVPDPKPKPGEVLVNITHAGLNYVDLLYSTGKHQNNHSGLVAPPFVLGLEFAGVVAEAHSWSRFQPGDRVWGGVVGAFAEKVAVKESDVQLVPGGWSLEDIAGLGAATAPVAYGALTYVAHLKRGETILIHGAAGGIAVLACQIARELGARVIGTVGSDAKATVLKDLGVDHVIRYDEDEKWEKKVLQLTQGKGVDVVFDTVGLVEKSLRCLTFGGRIVVAGFAGRAGNLEKLAMNRILLKGAKVVGYRYGESGRRDPAENARIWKELLSMLERGNIRPVVYQKYRGLEKVPEALHELAARKVYGKALIEVAKDEVRPKL